MHHWAAFGTSQILVELPWNILGSTLSFFCWYWTVGFPSSGLLVPVLLHPTADIASTIFSFRVDIVSMISSLIPCTAMTWSDSTGCRLLR